MSASRRGTGGGDPESARHVTPTEYREIERRALEQADDLAPLLDALGIDYHRGDAGRKLLARCPSPDHSDRGPSWFIANDPGDPRYGTHACQACKFRGGPTHLATRSEGGTGEWETGSKLLAELFLGDESSPESVGRLLDVRARRRARRKRKPFTGLDLDAIGLVSVRGTPGDAYLRDRGLTDFEIGFLRARWAPRGTEIEREDDDPLYLGERVILPVESAGICETFAARAVDRRRIPKYLYPPSPKERALWGLAYWTPRGTVGLVEGILDALAVFRVLRIPTYSVLGSRLSPSQAARLRNADRVVVFSDGDAAGDKLPDDAAELLPSVREVLRVELPRGADPGEYLHPESEPNELRAAYLEAETARTTRTASVIVQYGITKRRKTM